MTGLAQAPAIPAISVAQDLDEQDSHGRLPQTERYQTCTGALMPEVPTAQAEDRELIHARAM